MCCSKRTSSNTFELASQSRPWPKGRGVSLAASDKEKGWNALPGKKARVVAYIPARLGSKRLRKKNLKQFMGAPLIHWVLRATLLSSQIDEVWLNTESEELAEIGRDLGVNIYLRNSRLAQDETTTEEILSDFISAVSADYIAVVNPTNPLLRHQTIDDFLETVQRLKLDTAFSVSAIQKHLVRSGIPINYSPFGPHPRTQDVEKIHMINWAIVCWNYEMVSQKIKAKGDSLYVGKVDFLEIPTQDATDIDSAEDFQFAENLAEVLSLDTPVRERGNPGPKKPSDM